MSEDNTFAAAGAAQDTQNLIQLINAAVSPFHCVAYAAQKLEDSGFEELKLDTPWELKAGGKYYVNVYGSTLVALEIPDGYHPGLPFRVAAAHTDWPGFRIKPYAETESGRYAQLNVEAYGSPIYSTWMDRPLSIAGRVALRGESVFKPELRLVDFETPMLVIPNLAIHLHRDVNNGVKLNAQKDMLPVLGVLPKEWQMEDYFVDLLAHKLQVNKEEILSYELCIYNMDQPTLTGMNAELLSAPRLDNLTSVSACLDGILESRASEAVNVCALFDNEEVGSETKQGAASSMLPQLLEKVVYSLGGSREDYLNSVFGGLMLSADVAHALHPNHVEVHDITNKTYPTDGLTLKIHSGQRYATDACALGVVEGLCRQNQIPYRRFVNRSDVRGGSTLGSKASARLTMQTVDLGVSILAMHSARELMGASDQKALNDLMRAFYAE